MGAAFRQEESGSPGQPWQGRELHVQVRRNIESALDGRSWSWLAGEIGVPQSTLAGQVCKPRFSLEVVWRIARVLDLDLNELLGYPDRDLGPR